MTNYRMDYALDRIQDYIYEHKGIKVNIKPPNNQHEANIFDFICTKVFQYYKLP